MKRLPMFSIFLGAMILFWVLVADGIGFDAECANDQCKYIARGSLPGIFFGLGFGLLMFLLPRKETCPNPIRPVGVLRRFGAFYVDLGFILLVFSSLAELPILFVEAIHTGSFQWSFTREFARGTDWVVVTSGLLVLGLLFYYYYKSLLADRPTLGQYLCGYQITKSGEPWTPATALARMGATLSSGCGWPVAFIAAKHEKKAFRWDLKTDSIAERFRYADEVDLTRN